MTSPPSGLVSHIVGEVSPQTLDLLYNYEIGIVWFRGNKDAQWHDY